MAILRRRLNGVPMGTIVSAAMVPSQVTNFTTGTAGTNTIPVSYGVASGSAPIRYSGYQSVHGAAAWVLNAGSFSASGGTFVGLSPGTTYDLRIAASNSAGTTNTDLLGGISTQVQAASSFSVVLNRASGAAGSAVTMTVTPLSGSWPAGEVVTPSAAGLAGSFDNPSLTGAGTAPLLFTFTPAGSPGSSGTLTASASGMVNSSGPQSYAVVAVAASLVANRFDIVASSSAVAAGSPVQLTITPNAAFPSGTIVLSGTNGSFSSQTIALSAGSTGAIAVTYTPAASGEHAISATNNAGMNNPYPAPVTVFSAASGTAQSLSASLTRADMVTFQRDAASGNPAGFSLAWSKGWGEVWLNVSAIGGITGGLWVRLYDAMSPSASSTVGTGTALHSSPVQVYGTVSGPGVIRVLLPAGPYSYYADVASDAAFTNPVRISQRFRVGVVIAHFSRSQESGLSRAYAYTGNVPLPTNYTKTATWVGFDYRYADYDSGWFVHDGVTIDPYQYHYSESSSSGAQEIGRLMESQLGVCTGVAGSSASGGGLDEMVNHDGSLTGGFTGSIATAVGSKFRYFWMATGGWDGVDSVNYPNETQAELRTRFLGAIAWIASNYPACAVIGWGCGASGVFGADGSRLLGYTRNQMILLNEIEATNAMAVSKECYSWNEYYGGHATMAARVQYVRAGFRMFMAAEVSALGGLQSQNRGPRLSKTGTIRSGSRVISIPYTLGGGSSLQPVGISFSNPSFTVGTATSSELASLFTVYQSGGYQGNGTAIKVDTASINQAAGSIDITLNGSTGIVYADNSTAAMPSSFSVQFAADFGASNSSVQFGVGRAVMITDDRVDAANGIPHGWHMRPALDIAISTV